MRFSVMGLMVITPTGKMQGTKEERQQEAKLIQQEPSITRARQGQAMLRCVLSEDNALLFAPRMNL